MTALGNRPRLVLAACAAAASLAVGVDAGRAEGPPPKLDLTLSPHPTGGADSYLGVRMVLEHPDLKAGGGLVRLPLKLVGIPTARYDGDALTARDDDGAIPLSQSEEPPTPQGVYRRWSVGRATHGDVTVSFRAPPRAVTAATNNGPLFDLREEAGAFLGAGVGFLATPVAPGPWRVRLAWDLSAAPAGSRGVWSYGDGAVETVLPSDALAFSYYAAGALKRFPESGDGRFGYYWASQPPFDPADLARRIQALYGSMSAFFDDTSSSYRVFARSNPYLGHGGTSLAHSFMYGYHAASKPTADSLQLLIAHEMAHTWPAMQGEHGDTAWYSEGTAEYYSLALSWRAKAIDLDKVVRTLNERADAYYTNPYRSLSNPQAAEKFWTDPVAQTVPYGRGWLYLVETDAEIRAASKGRRSLDDVVKQLYRQETAKQPYGVPQWLELVGKEIGPAKAKAGYDHMASGGLMKPPTDAFAPCLTLVSHPARPFVLGFARNSLNDERVVKDLVPGSAADKAGIRNGDTIVEVNDVNKVRADETLPIVLTLRRGETRQTVTYLPRGAAVEGYRWKRNPKAPAGACRF
ncbi:MAG: PDZ domain-containing protein [Proteobacteria bacterium]|nr:PDZ domain-containing protein [Pseudomonadota bacterium]